MATRQELSDFLASVERRAFRQASFSVRDDHLALDLVQDAMTRLVERYADRPAAELPLVFQRILQNVITDHFRRQKVRNLWTTLLSSLSGGEQDGEERDALESLDGDPGVDFSATQTVEREQTLAIIDEEIRKLPRRQREAFLLRYWEEMDVAETAAIMGCSEGSVKTHCSRATRALAAALKARGIAV